MARSHAAVGVASWLVAAPLLHVSPWDVAGLVSALAGAMLPDIDHPQSWVGRRTRPVSTVLAGVFGHRGVTHSALAVAALLALLARGGLSRAAVCGLVVGYLSHLAADLLTPRGLRLAWPLRRTWGWPLCRTGSPAEPLLVAALCLLAAWSREGGGHWPALQPWLARSWALASRVIRPSPL